MAQHVCKWRSGNHAERIMSCAVVQLAGSLDCPTMSVTCSARCSSPCPTAPTPRTCSHSSDPWSEAAHCDVSEFQATKLPVPVRHRVWWQPPPAALSSTELDAGRCLCWPPTCPVGDICVRSGRLNVSGKSLGTCIQGSVSVNETKLNITSPQQCSERHVRAVFT